MSKVLILLPGIEPNGITTHAIDLICGLDQLGHEILVITGDMNTGYSNIDGFYHKMVACGAKIKMVEKPKGNLFYKALVSLKLIVVTSIWLQKYNPDIIHAHSPHMAIIPWLNRRKFIITLHQTHNLTRNWKIKAPTRLISISKESYEFGKRLFKLSSNKVDLIHHGISDRFSHPTNQLTLDSLKEKLGINKKKIVLGFVGSIEKRKGQDIMVEALKNLSDNTKEKVHFVFLGGNTNESSYKWLFSLVNEAEIQDFVSIIPFQDPKPYYDMFEIFILPSRKEAFPLVVIEAMMSGCCIIRSNVEGASEQIEEGFNGYLFQNENAYDLSRLIEKLVGNDTLRKKLMVNARQKAINEFTIPKMAQKTVQVYNKLIQN